MFFLLFLKILIFIYLSNVHIYWHIDSIHGDKIIGCIHKYGPDLQDHIVRNRNLGNPQKFKLQIISKVPYEYLIYIWLIAVNMTLLKEYIIIIYIIICYG